MRRLGLPPFPGGSPARALVLVETLKQQRVVASACDIAQARGVKPGMTLAHARALLPTDALIAPFTPEQDRAALSRLARWALRFAPVVTPDPPNGLLLDIAGCAHLYGGEERMLEAVLGSLKALGLYARGAIASTFGCAWALARFGDGRRTIVPQDREEEALAPLPVAALRVAPEVVLSLAEVGVGSIGELLSLPRGALPARFGCELGQRLDQAIGRLPESIEPVRPQSPMAVERIFDGPTTQQEAILLAARELIERLCHTLASQERGVLRMELVLVRPGDTPVRLFASLTRPSRCARHLWRLLGPQLERAHLGYGVEALVLTAKATRRIVHQQAQRWREDQAASDEEHALGEMIDTLVCRLGQERVLTLHPVESHRPERAQRPVPYTAGKTLPPARLVSADRPSVLFAQPEPAEVMALFPDGPPSWMRWRGRESRVLEGLGPERIGPEWWRSRESGRDYFKIKDQDHRWLWVFRELTSARWFVHGLWA